MKPYNILLLFYFFLSGQILFSQDIPSFPGAEGFGAKATGGRGGSVIYVTNLNASGPGSFNEALSTPGPRYIMFKVSGVIDAAAELREGDVTIAGQTSPGGIITRGFIVDQVYESGGSGDNIIVRHLRSRPHDPEIIPSDNYVLDDGMRLDGASNIIVDHCSFANARDECVQVSQSHDVTIQNCMLSETVGPHYIYGGMLINYSTPEHPQDKVSIHHNTWNRIAGRLPEIICESPYCGSAPLQIELSDNLLWDPQNYVWYGANIDPSGEDYSFFLHLNWVNNYLYGRLTFPFGMMEHRFLEYASNQIYGSGNKMNIYPDYSDYQLFYCCNDFYLPENHPNTDMGVAQQLSSRHNFPEITYTPATDLPDYIVNNCGAFPRDSMDRRLINPIAQMTIDPHPVDGTDYFHDAFITTTPPTAPDDTDEDGMPDYWEMAQGLNPEVQDHNGTDLSVAITGISGYTNLECYLNCLSDGLVNGSSTPECGIILPVVLKNFETKKENKSTILHWRVTDEKNCIGYEVERKSNSLPWTKIGFVPARTKTFYENRELVYAYTDMNPADGNNYYRIKILDKDGGYQYSIIRQQSFNGGADWIVYPNPARDFTLIKGINGKTTVELLELMGKVIERNTHFGPSIELDLKGVKEGVYVVKITNEQGLTQSKMIMKK